MVNDIPPPFQYIPELAAAISRLRGAGLSSCTNGWGRHAERVAAKLGVLDAFDGVFDITAGHSGPKRERGVSFARFLDFGAENNKAATIEEMPSRDLSEAAPDLGIVTVLVRWDVDDHPWRARSQARGRACPNCEFHFADTDN